MHFECLSHHKNAQRLRICKISLDDAVFRINFAKKPFDWYNFKEQHKVHHQFKLCPKRMIILEVILISVNITGFLKCATL